MSFVASNIGLLIRAEIRRTVWDMGKHLTLFACAAALVGLFFYIFKDFVGEQLATLNPDLSRQGLKILSIAGGVFSGAVAATTMLKLSTLPRSLLPLMKRIGSHSESIQLQFCGTIVLPLSIAVLFAAGWGILLKAHNAGTTVALAATCALLIRYLTAHKALTAIIEPTSQHATGATQKHGDSIHDWRRHQILNHRMPGRGLMILSILGGILLPAAILAHPHYFLLQAVALCISITASFGIVYAVAADLPGTWFEKQAGLTHEAWTKSWQRIATILTLILLVCGLAAFLLLPASERSHAIALPIITAFMPWITPALILQIDGRAKSANLLVSLLIGLFIGTAMIATPWAALVIPILKSQAAGYQTGRFYRA